jgi:hypothetical protein
MHIRKMITIAALSRSWQQGCRQGLLGIRKNALDAPSTTWQALRREFLRQV